MTTIVYHHKSKKIALDSRSCRDGTIISDSVIKMTERDGVKFFFAGYACDNTDFIDKYFNKGSDKKPDCYAFVVDCGEVFRCGVTDSGEMWKQEVTHDDAIGSGWQHALSAMDLGLDAVSAVRHAASRDCYTGGILRAYDIERGELYNEL